MYINNIGLSYRNDGLGIINRGVKRFFDIVISIPFVIITTVLWFYCKKSRKSWFDVFCGKTTIVGPALYNLEDSNLAYNNDVEVIRRYKKGIISEASLYAPKGATAQQLIEYDIRYISHRSLSVDLMIIIDYIIQKLHI